jgi:hypothetical protein
VLDFDYLYNYHTANELLHWLWKVKGHDIVSYPISWKAVRLHIKILCFRQNLYVLIFQCGILSSCRTMTYYCATKIWQFILQMCDVASNSWLTTPYHDSQKSTHILTLLGQFPPNELTPRHRIWKAFPSQKSTFKHAAFSIFIVVIFIFYLNSCSWAHRISKIPTVSHRIL